MIVPVLHRLLVKPRKLEEANSTYKKMHEMGFVIPDGDIRSREAKAVEIGTVIAIGDTAFTGPFATSVVPQVGDSIYFAKYAGKEVVNEDGENYLLLNDEDCVAIIKE